MWRTGLHDLGVVADLRAGGGGDCNSPSKAALAEYCCPCVILALLCACTLAKSQVPIANLGMLCSNQRNGRMNLRTMVRSIYKATFRMDVGQPDGIAMTIQNLSRSTPDRMDLPFRGEPLHPVLVSFPIAYFTAAFVTDLAYWQTAAVLWETFSDWLITAGLITAGFAVIAFVIDLVRGKRSRTLAWPHAVGYMLAVLLSLVNAFVHSRDGYTAVVPTGLMLSGLVVVVLLITGWMGQALIARRREGADL
jgi:uncharacterized membrane protein